MEVIDDLVAIYGAVTNAKRIGKRVGVVPTMGALHEGHLSLVREAKKVCDFVVVTIFVNPTQFAAGEDLEKYPRPIENDLALLKSHDVDVAFCPDHSKMYPNGFSTFVQPPEISKPLEGSFRESHFQGVATIVLKFFQLVPAEEAFFGQKDYQQTLVVQRMVEDLNVPVKIVVCPIYREPDGLAMSSRNVYLSERDRSRATIVNRVLCEIETKVSDGDSDFEKIVAEGFAILESEVDSIDYLKLVDSETLLCVDEHSDKIVALAAVHIGGTRLIDNRIIELNSTSKNG